MMEKPYHVPDIGEAMRHDLDPIRPVAPVGVADQTQVAREIELR